MDEEAARFYSRFRFQPSPLREDQLQLLLKDARWLMAGWSIESKFLQRITDACKQLFSGINV